eukprot:scaffold3504_cov240-Pinguiococcus_pyrenoidosus.AAC.1
MPRFPRFQTGSGAHPEIRRTDKHQKSKRDSKLQARIPDPMDPLAHLARLLGYLVVEVLKSRSLEVSNLRRTRLTAKLARVFRGRWRRRCLVTDGRGSCCWYGSEDVDELDDPANSRVSWRDKADGSRFVERMGYSRQILAQRLREESTAGFRCDHWAPISPPKAVVSGVISCRSLRRLATPGGFMNSSTLWPKKGPRFSRACQPHRRNPNVAAPQRGQHLNAH